MKAKTARRFVSALVVGALVLPAGLAAKDKRGATVVVTRTDGQVFEGELIAVKPDSLFLLSADGRDVTADLADIREVRIVRRARALLLAGIVGAAGATAGATVGAYVFNGGSDDEPSSLRNGLIFGALGALAGLGASLPLGTDARFRYAEATEERRGSFLNGLKDYSREGRLRVKPGRKRSSRPRMLERSMR